MFFTVFQETQFMIIQQNMTLILMTPHANI